LRRVFPRRFETVLSVACRSPHLRFAKIGPKTSRGVFSDTAAGKAPEPKLVDFLQPFPGFTPSSSVPISPLR
jgi:hypothetical protein